MVGQKAEAWCGARGARARSLAPGVSPGKIASSGELLASRYQRLRKKSKITVVVIPSPRPMLARARNLLCFQHEKNSRFLAALGMTNGGGRTVAKATGPGWAGYRGFRCASPTATSAPPLRGSGKCAVEAEKADSSLRSE